jgi:hypothetical protein
MAAPMVAGAAAIYIAANPGASVQSTVQAIKSSATQGVLTTNDTSSPNLLLYSRFGLSTTSAPVSINGSVRNAAGFGVRGVQITLVELTTGESISTRTNLIGLFCFQNVTNGMTYTVTAVPNSRFQIFNNLRTISLLDSLTGVDFVADTFVH